MNNREEDDQSARAARARHIHARIAEVLSDAETPAAGEEESPPGDSSDENSEKSAPESPQEFIQRRMRELDD